jgi:hypothetical protein
LRVAVPWLPLSVAEWFQRACARDPQQRFQSADELIAALDLALGVSGGVQQGQGSTAEVKIDTLRGHAPPVAHAVPRPVPEGAGAFGAGTTQVLGMDPRLLKSAPALAASMQGELTVPTTSRAPLFALLGLLGLGALGGLAWLWGGHRAAPLEGAPAASAPLSAETPAAPRGPALSATATVAPAAESASAPASGAPAGASARPTPAPTPTPTPVHAGTAVKSPENAEPRPTPRPRNTITDIGF